VVALAGLSALKFRRFLAIMVVGRIPGSTATALLEPIVWSRLLDFDPARCDA
jgi:uncharacterized membrane protein YdjX (TVP38/TMEM64 family)